MTTSHLRFASRAEHRAFIAAQARLPRGFRAACVPVDFQPVEVSRPARMNLSLLVLDRPSPDFAALFTRNAFPGAPVRVGRERLHEPALGAIVINNKISNVGSPTGVADAEAVCAAAGRALALPAGAVLPSSTGIIGWRLPVGPMCAAVPALVGGLQADSALPVAEGILTTDLYPKVRAETVGEGRLVGLAKGAGMIEPHLATMLVFLLTDLQVPRAALRAMLARAADESFNCLSVDGDTSTSDMVVALSSGAMPPPSLDAFEAALVRVCRALAGDIVRNGEGVHHVLRVRVTGAPTREVARRLGRAVVNSPLVKTAMCGNDPNVGRLAAALGKAVALDPDAGGVDLQRARITMDGHTLLDGGAFALDPRVEAALATALSEAELYRSQPSSDGVFRAPIDFPPHERCVDIAVELRAGGAEAEILGADLSHEYVSENADYRS